jgi:hypothetical protein
MIRYYGEFPERDFNPMLFSGEVLFSGYVSKYPTIRSIRAGYGNLSGECEIEFVTPPLVHAYLTIKEGPPVTLTYRTFLSRPSIYGR